MTAEPSRLEQIDLWVDDGLSAAETAGLALAVAQDAELDEQRRTLSKLRSVLADDRIEVNERFAQSVLERLPSRSTVENARAVREPVSSRVWLLAIVAVLVLAVAASALFRLGDGASTGTFGALAGFFASTLVAGAGLLDASWRGLGGIVSGWLGESGLNRLLLGSLVVSANLLLIALLRRRRARARAPQRTGSDGQR